MTGCIIGSLACGFLVGIFIALLMASRSLQSREEEMREYYLAELEKIRHGRRKEDDDLLRRHSESNPAVSEDLRIRMEQQLSEGTSGRTQDRA